MVGMMGNLMGSALIVGNPPLIVMQLEGVTGLQCLVILVELHLVRRLAK